MDPHELYPHCKCFVSTSAWTEASCLQHTGEMRKQQVRLWHCVVFDKLHPVRYNTLTCLIDFIAQRKPCPLVGIVRGEFNVQNGARGDDRGGCDVTAVSPQQISGLRVPIPDLNEVIPMKNQTQTRLYRGQEHTATVTLKCSPSCADS